MADQHLRDLERAWLNDPAGADPYDVAYIRAGLPGTSPPRRAALQRLLAALWEKAHTCDSCGGKVRIYVGIDPAHVAQVTARTCRACASIAAIQFHGPRAAAELYGSLLEDSDG